MGTDVRKWLGANEVRKQIKALCDEVGDKTSSVFFEVWVEGSRIFFACR